MLWSSETMTVSPFSRVMVFPFSESGGAGAAAITSASASNMGFLSPGGALLPCCPGRRAKLAPARPLAAALPDLLGVGHDQVHHGLDRARVDVGMRGVRLEDDGVPRDEVVAFPGDLQVQH